MNESNRKAILDHIDKIEQYAKTDPWLMSELRRRFGGVSDTRIDEIYEYCIEKVIREQAEQFYKYFPIKELTPSLVEDLCRMERYKRDDNFEDFCLATFQQVENITNWFCQRQKFIDLYESKRDTYCCFRDKTGNPICTIRELIINTTDIDKYNKRKDLPLMSLYFNERVRAVLYFVYFGEKTTKYVYDSKYNEMNELYQCRNLNHRGGDRTDYQENLISEILPYQYQYYLKFTGLLSDYIEHINRFMSRKEVLGIITSVLPSGAVYIKPENGDIIVIDKGKLWYKVKSLKKDDKVIIERNGVTNEIISINSIA